MESLLSWPKEDATALTRTDILRWWETRLREDDTIGNPPGGLLTDRKWIDLVPGLFPGTVRLHDDTYHVAWWNLHQRTVSRDGDRYFVNGRPLAFFHFSGFDPGRPEVFASKNPYHPQLIPGTALADLVSMYVDLHVQNDYRQVRQWPGGYCRFDNGVSVSMPFRRLYLQMDPKTRQQFGNPFQSQGPHSFFEWATRPDPTAGNLSPFLQSVYQVRFDLWPLFPDVKGAAPDRDGFLEWARIHGSRELKYDPALMRIN